jgi:hypothetical protein
MSDQTKHENGHGSFERQDLQVSGILYFLLTIVVVTILCLFGLRGVFAFLDHREKALQPALNPLVTHVPTDTRHIPKDYEEKAFPDPLLEKDEHTKIDDLRSKEEQTLYSYGWVDEKAGTVRIPIDRAMELLVQRGLPVHPQGAASETPAKIASIGAGKKGKKK